MFEPVRGGTRGGQAEFKWADVSQDKDRENYLGHSINAPTGRWQKNKDIHWYNRDQKQTENERAEEIRKIKEAEEEAIAAALGFGPAAGGTAGASALGLTASSPTMVKAGATGSSVVAVDAGKEEKRRKKAERKEEKRVKKEKRRMERGGHGRSRSRSRDVHGDDDYERRRRRDRERSRSPRLRRSSMDREGALRRRSRSKEQIQSRREEPEDSKQEQGNGDAYDAARRERERERDRRIWDMNTRRDR